MGDERRPVRGDMTREWRGPRLSGKSQKVLAAYIFLLPALAGLVVFRILPIANTFIGSLFALDYHHGGERIFVGLGNYLSLFSDFVFWDSVKVTLLFNIAVNPLQIAIALLLALLVQSNTRANRFFRSFYILPLGVSITVSAAVWGILLHPNDGLVNGLLQLVRLPMQPFLTSARQAIWCIILIASWYGISYWMIILLAGLQDISAELYEAALIDGCSVWDAFWKITLPLLKRVLLFVIVADTSANFLLFAPIYVLTKGGPRGTTNTLMYEAYTSVFVQSDLARGLTISTVLLLLVLIVIRFEFRFFREKTE